VEPDLPRDAAPPPSPESSVPHPRPPDYPAAAESRWRPSNLTLRLLTSSVLVPLVIWLCWMGGWLYVGAVVAFAALGTHEFYSFIEAKGATPHRTLGVAAAMALPIVVYVGDAFWATSLMTMVLLGAMLLQLAKAEIGEAIVSISATFFGVVYVGWLLAHAVSLRFIQVDLVRRHGEVAAVDLSPEVGFFFILLCLAPAVGCDAGAYFVGRRYGRHQLAPRISPNKSVEGAIGGILLGALAAAGMKLVFDAFVPGGLASSFSIPAAFSLGVVAATVGILGDLIESVLKRDADLKDAGKLLPGVGGIMDRIDSGLIAIPITYYLLLAYYYARYQF
jgi:phosphatidate cytidylyltransferase